MEVPWGLQASPITAIYAVPQASAIRGQNYQSATRFQNSVALYQQFEGLVHMLNYVTEDERVK